MISLVVYSIYISALVSHLHNQHYLSLSLVIHLLVGRGGVAVGPGVPVAVDVVPERLPPGPVPPLLVVDVPEQGLGDDQASLQLTHLQ